MNGLFPKYNNVSFVFESQEAERSVTKSKNNPRKFICLTKRINEKEKDWKNNQVMAIIDH